MALMEHDTLLRYFHILSGIMWIGLLYFFNFVNLPLAKFNLKKPYDVNMAEKASPHITLKSLFWFRWAAMFTFLFGLLLIGSAAERYDGLADYFFGSGFSGYMITMGVAFGIIMWFNVWFIIWPNQQKVLTNNKAIAEGADEPTKKRLSEENAPLLKSAVIASRTNTWLSIPMLFGMVFGAHGDGGGLTEGDNGLYLVVLVLLLVVLYFMSTRKTTA